MSPQSPDGADRRPVADAAEADAAEQATPVAPDEIGHDPLADVAAQIGSISMEADPADVWEQSVSVVDGDDDYDHDSRER